jgi:hypothetical protein
MKWTIMLLSISVILTVVLAGCVVSVENSNDAGDGQLYARGCCDLPSTDSCAGDVSREICHKSVEEGGLDGVFLGFDYQCISPFTGCTEVPVQNESELEELEPLGEGYADSSTFGCCEVPDDTRSCYLTANSSVCDEYGGEYFGQEFTCTGLTGGCVAKADLNESGDVGEVITEPAGEDVGQIEEPPVEEVVVEQDTAPSTDDSGGDNGCCEVPATNGCASPVSRDICHGELNGVFVGSGHICDGNRCVVETQGD